MADLHTVGISSKKAIICSNKPAVSLIGEMKPNFN